MTTVTLKPIPSVVALSVRILCEFIVALLFYYLINNYLVFWLDWPKLSAFGTSSFGVFGWIKLIALILLLPTSTFYVLKTRKRKLAEESTRFSNLAAYIIRASFWTAVLIGCVDMIISFLRVEGLLEIFVTPELLADLGRPSFRGLYVHYPLIVLSLIIAFFSRSLSFIWLTFLVVMSELIIVITRFVFSYEQVFMGDVVRFWYAALFLFASSYTLLKEGHVRVDVLYTHFSQKRKAISNIIGSFILGIPLCWVILWQGMEEKGSSLNAPLLNFEISQSGYGLYIKYLMAGFLAIFAISMMIQFVSDILNKTAILCGETIQEDNEIA